MTGASDGSAGPGADQPHADAGEPLLAELVPEAATPPEETAPAGPAEGYRVLARKYRPATFDDLVGQEPMVRTLSNAFAAGRIPQAWMLTGVRGVGKTTTARILARALNYETADGGGEPTIALAEPGVHCRAIMEGRHVDVIEMDAASHTSINDIREITDAARYRPVSARYKVYIIDEVHMLSQAAFNGLLKTLEEPPPHVKFVFATTEIRKVPITVLSRCQRFDLRRVPGERLVEHLSKVAVMEAVDVEAQALRLVARAAEGSVRDALSLLDQAIAHGAGRVTAEDVKAMLGLADRGRVIDLFERLVAGDAAGALDELGEQHAVGADPAVVLTDLAAFVHLVTRLKVAPEAPVDATANEDEVARGRTHAAALSTPALGRLWQGLLKGIDEVHQAPMPLAAAEMVLVRLAHLSTLPTPEEAMRRLGDGAATAGAGSGEAAPPCGAAPDGASASVGSGGPAEARAAPDRAPAPPAPAAETAEAGPRIRSLRDIAALAGEKRAVRLKVDVERFVRPVKIEDGRIEIALDPGAPGGLVGDLSARLAEWTGRRWVVTVANEPGGETLAEAAARTKAEATAALESNPMVKAVFETFPDARIVDVRINAPEDEVAGGLADPDAPLDPDDAARVADDPGAEDD